MIAFPKTTTLEVELTSKCTLACPKCPRVTRVDERHIWDNGHIDADRLIEVLDTPSYDVVFAGSYGDGVYHPRLVEVLSHLKKNGIHHTFETNGSYVKDSVWHGIGQNVGPTDTIVFSVDGTPDNFMQYRVNGHWPTIRRGMEILKEYNIRTRWKYIVFKYNSSYEDMKTAYDLACELGIKQFQLVHTKRTVEGQYVEIADFQDNLSMLEEYYSELVHKSDTHVPRLRIQIHPRTRKVKEMDKIAKVVQKRSKEIDINNIDKQFVTRQAGSTAVEITQVKEKYVTEHVDPQCINVDKFAHFIGSDGMFYPCCYTRTQKGELIRDLELTEEDVASMNIANNSINEIKQGPGYKKLLEGFDKLSTCKLHCGK